MTLYAGHVEVRFDGALHFKSLYKEIHEWIIENDYAPSAKDWDFPETLYYESKSQPAGREVWVWFRPMYVPEGNPFYRYILRVNVFAQKLKDLDIMHNNKRATVQQGEFRVLIDAFIESDYQKKFQNHPILKHFYEIFLKRIIWRDFVKKKNVVLSDAYRLQKRIKEFCGTVQADSTGEPFRAVKGIE